MRGLPARPTASLHLLLRGIVARIVMRIPISFPLPREEMAEIFNSVSLILPSVAEATVLILFPGYVGYSPSLGSVVVAHQGTNPAHLYVPYVVAVGLTG